MPRIGIMFLSLLLVTPTTNGQQPVDITSQTQTDPSLPPVLDLMHEVERNEDTIQKMQRDYTYHVHTEEEDTDSKGNIKKTEITDAESLELDGIRINRVVARNGKPLTPKETKKEDDRIDKEIAKAKERKAKLESQGKPVDSNGSEELTISRILQLGIFSNERRADLNGRPTIVVDYAGDPTAKTKTRFETIFRDLVGTVWIDEEDITIVQLQGHFLNDFKIGGGLVADVKRDSSFSATFTKVNQEAWLPAEIEGRGKIRLFLIAGFTGHFRVMTSDYRKFRTTSTIVSTNHVISSTNDGPETTPKPQ